MNKLAVFQVATDATKLILQDNSLSGGLNISKVQCRAYQDFAGVRPRSTVFTVKKPAVLVNALYRDVRSILCYIAEEA